MDAVKRTPIGEVVLCPWSAAPIAKRRLFFSSRRFAVYSCCADATNIESRSFVAYGGNALSPALRSPAHCGNGPHSDARLYYSKFLLDCPV